MAANLRQKEIDTFNPHFTRTHFEIMITVIFPRQIYSFQSSFYEDTFWNHIIEQRLVVLKNNFQSSFYEDTFWNRLSASKCSRPQGLSILILRGHILKFFENLISTSVIRIFQSSFYEDTFWNYRGLDMYKSADAFNPHFTRTHFEMSDWETPIWRFAMSFNPHFTRTHFEMAWDRISWNRI